MTRNLRHTFEDNTVLRLNKGMFHTPDKIYLGLSLFDVPEDMQGTLIEINRIINQIFHFRLHYRRCYICDRQRPESTSWIRVGDHASESARLSKTRSRWARQWWDECRWIGHRTANTGRESEDLWTWMQMPRWFVHLLSAPEHPKSPAGRCR